MCSDCKVPHPVPVKDPTCDGRADVNRRYTMSTCNYVSKNGRCIAPPVAGKQHSRCARHGCPSSGCNGEKSSSDATCGRCADTDTNAEVSGHRPSCCIEPLPMPPMLPMPAPTRCPHRHRGDKSDCQARRRRRISFCRWHWQPGAWTGGERSHGGSGTA